MKSLGPRIAQLDMRTAHPPEKRADAFYLTPEHRAWRETVLRRAGWRCQAPGCGQRNCQLYADHIAEISDGGAPLDPLNGQALCAMHHSLKTAVERAKRTRKRHRSSS